MVLRRKRIVIEINGTWHKSFDIFFMLLHRGIADGILPNRLRALDITYGRGRLWRRARVFADAIIGVDIEKHDFEVEPTAFYQHDSRDVGYLYGLAREYGVNLVVVDPPWNYEKRGRMPQGTGISAMPYHLDVDSRPLVWAAVKLSGMLGAPVAYRYKKPLPDSRIVFKARIKFFNEGYVYYGIALPPGGSRL